MNIAPLPVTSGVCGHRVAVLGLVGAGSKTFSNTATLRSLTTGAQVTDSQTVGSLFSQFDSNAATPWFTRTLAITQPAEQIEVTLTVANAVDNAYLSILYADLVMETRYRITNLQLRDLIDQNDPYATKRQARNLTRLSTSIMPTVPAGLRSYDGYVRVHGTITIAGPGNDQLQDVRIEVWDNGHRAVGHLARASVSNVRTLLLNRPLGATGVSVSEIAPNIAPLLFEIPSSEFSQFSQTTDNDAMTVQIHATLSTGAEIHPILTVHGNGQSSVPKPFTKLVLYTGTGRYGDRNEADCTGLQNQTKDANKPPFPCGSDSWARPTVVTFASTVQGVTWGDFSNMNGGFFPPHGSHRKGIDIDGKFEGYAHRDAAAAQKMIEYLNLYGRKIEKVFVAYSECATADPAHCGGFGKAIKDVRLLDGRMAGAVIRPEASHTTHFHWRLDASRLQE